MSDIAVRPHYIIPTDHKWIKLEWLPMESCLLCGVFKRADGKNKPCRGRVNVGPRA